MLRKRGFWITTLILAAIAVGGSYFYYTSSVSAETTTETEQVQTAVARVGEIVVSATGAGTVIAASDVELGFSTSGRLTEMLVQVGDNVQAGDVLARINDTDAQQTLANAQLQLAQAAMQTNASATEVGVSYDDISVEQAQINLELAQTALDDLLNWEPDPDEIALAEANLAAAEASYNAARGQEAATSTNITVNGITVDQAERSLAEAQAAYDTAYDPGRDWELNDPRRADALEAERDRTAESLLRAQESLRVAQLNYNASVSSTNSSSSTNAQSNLLSAQQALTTTQTGPTDEEITSARMTVRQAELSLQQAKLNEEANALSLQQAELNVLAAQEAITNTILVAPMAGTVTAVNYSVGETASGTVIVLADLEQPSLEVYLDETDMNMIGVGYEVDVVFDALPDETFTGKVTLIDPQLVNENGVTAVRALVQLNPDSFAKPQTLPVGLNATVEVIGGRAENAVLVPVEALREISTGQYAVFVMENGEPKLRLVEVGLMDFSFAEITSGLEAGAEVTTGIVQTQ